MSLKYKLMALNNDLECLPSMCNFGAANLSGSGGIPTYEFRPLDPPLVYICKYCLVRASFLVITI